MKSCSTTLHSEFVVQFIAIADALNRHFLSPWVIITANDFIVLLGFVVRYSQDNQSKEVVARKVHWEWIEYLRIDAGVIPNAARLFSPIDEPFQGLRLFCSKLVERARQVQRLEKIDHVETSKEPAESTEER